MPYHEIMLPLCSLLWQRDPPVSTHWKITGNSGNKKPFNFQQPCIQKLPKLTYSRLVWVRMDYDGFRCFTAAEIAQWCLEKEGSLKKKELKAPCHPELICADTSSSLKPASKLLEQNSIWKNMDGKNKLAPPYEAHKMFSPRWEGVPFSDVDLEHAFPRPGSLTPMACTATWSLFSIKAMQNARLPTFISGLTNPATLYCLPITGTDGVHPYYFAQL